MGLLEQITAGARFTRRTVQLPTGPVTGQINDFGSTFILLNVSTTSPCRVRLYFDSSSRATDQPRTTASFDVSASVGLILDTYIPAGTSSISFDPPVFGTSLDAGNVWYTVDETASTPVVQFLAYPIESSVLNDRETLEIRRTSFLNTGSATGTLTSPRSFLILSASATSESRLRLYSRPIAQVPAAEQSRPFGTEPPTGSSLIVDMLFDSASFEYKMSPIPQAYNLESYSVGGARVYYILQNTSVNTPINYTASLYVYSLED